MSTTDLRTETQTVYRVPPPPREVVCFWLTRDSEIGGCLSDRIDVWLVKPERMKLSIDGGICWWAEGGCFSQTSIGGALSWCGTYPEDDIQSIRVERWVQEEGKT